MIAFCSVEGYKNTALNNYYVKPLKKQNNNRKIMLSLFLYGP